MVASPTTIEALPKQIEFLQSRAIEVLYSGAFAAGKTWATAMKCAMRASHPLAREGLCRKHLVSLKATTLRTLLNGDGGTPPILPPGSYIHHKTDKIIKIKGGGEITYFGLDTPEKGGSYNLTGCGLDEAVDFTEDDYAMIVGRVRMRVDGVYLQTYGACNPGAPTHFLAKRFGLAGGHQPMPGRHAIRTRSSDNSFLPQAYLDQLDTFTGVRRKRYVEGIWAGAEGLVYDHWDRERNVQTIDTSNWERRIIGVDDGYSNPFCALLIAIDSDGRMHIEREVYQSNMLMEDKVEAVRRLGEHEAAMVDPSAALLIAELQRVGVDAQEAENDVLAGINRVQQRLDEAGDGRPRLTVDPMCENVIKEIETYEWDKARDGKPKDKPKKAWDHAMDALRYAVMRVDQGYDVFFGMAEGTAAHTATPQGFADRFMRGL